MKSLTLGTIVDNAGAIGISADGSLTVNGTITDSDSSSNGIVTLASDQAGSTPANITFSAGATVNAANQGYLAGTGLSGASGSAVVFTNGTFQGASGASSNVQSFGFQQDASINDSQPALAQFTSGVLPTNYAIGSLGGDVTRLTFANVANTNLAVASANGDVTFGSASASSSLSLASLSVLAANGTIFLDNNGSFALGTSGVVNGSTNGQIYSGSVVIARHDIDREQRRRCGLC